VCRALLTAKASIEHLDKLYEIEKACFAKEAFTKHQLARLLGDPDSVALISQVEGETVGFIIGKVRAKTKPASGHILTIDVLPEHRHKGVGRRLLQEIEAEFTDKCVKICCLEVREDNTPALNLYERSGYKKVGRLKNYYGKQHGIRLRKVLA